MAFYVEGLGWGMCLSIPSTSFQNKPAVNQSKQARPSPFCFWTTPSLFSFCLPVRASCIILRSRKEADHYFVVRIDRKRTSESCCSPCFIDNPFIVTTNNMSRSIHKFVILFVSLLAPALFGGAWTTVPRTSTR
jgi:hypothetical protein